MENLRKTNDFKSIVLNDTKLIDVRAPIEYEKGAMYNTVNLPILTNEERHIIGICYKENGNEEATKLGYKMVSGDIKKERLEGWDKYIKENPNSMIYCFRGGSRSTIAQRWIYEELGQEIVKLDGGYKAYRNYLIEALNPENINSTPLVLTGYTGSGKTEVLPKLKNAIDLEGIANHRGSTFGHHTTPQPTQINFENNLAYNIIKHNESNFKYMIFEDEGKNIGKNFIPKEFFSHFHYRDIVFLESTVEERVLNILKDYVIDGQKEHITFKCDEELGLTSWYNDMLESMLRVKKKVGGDRLNVMIESFNRAYSNQIKGQGIDSHRDWIELFLLNYYDPMYSHSIKKDKRNIMFSGNKAEVIEYLKALEE